MHAKSLQSCLSLCDPMDCSPPVFSVLGIFQARILEWLPCPPPGHLSNPGIKPMSLTSPALASGFFTTGATGKPLSTATWFNLCFKNQSTEYCVDKGSEQTKVELGRAVSTLGFAGSSTVKIPPAMQEPQEKQIQSLGEEDPLEKEMASHSSVLTWRIPMDRGAWRTTVHGAAKRWT